MRMAPAAEIERRDARQRFSYRMFEDPVLKNNLDWYRLLREKKSRITVIYLNHLEKKYPNWEYALDEEGVEGQAGGTGNTRETA